MSEENVKRQLVYKYVTDRRVSPEERQILHEEWLFQWRRVNQEPPLLFLCHRGDDIQPLSPSDADTIAEWVSERMQKHGARNYNVQPIR